MKKLTKKKKLRNKILWWSLAVIVALVVIFFSVIQVFTGFFYYTDEPRDLLFSVTSVSTKTPVGYMTTSDCPEILDYESTSNQWRWNEALYEGAGGWETCAEAGVSGSRWVTPEYVECYNPIYIQGASGSYSYNPIDHCMSDGNVYESIIKVCAESSEAWTSIRFAFGIDYTIVNPICTFDYGTDESCKYDFQLYSKTDEQISSYYGNSGIIDVADGEVSGTAYFSGSALIGGNVDENGAEACMELFISEKSYVDARNDGVELYQGAKEVHYDEVSFGVDVTSVRIYHDDIVYEEIGGGVVIVDNARLGGGSTYIIVQEDEIIKEEIIVNDIEASNWDKLKDLFSRDDNEVIVRKWYNPFSWFGNKDVIETIDNSINDADESENNLEDVENISNEPVLTRAWIKIKSWFGK